MVTFSLAVSSQPEVEKQLAFAGAIHPATAFLLRNSWPGDLTSCNFSLGLGGKRDVCLTFLEFLGCISRFF